MEKVISGVLKFKSAPYEERKQLFSDLANGQSPEVLFITCSDSRIDPNLVTQTEPGDLFIIRNAGNIVPPRTLHAGGVTASIEFAVAALGVQHIIVCGHTDCGAMKGALDVSKLDALPHVQDWLSNVRAAVDVVKAVHGSASAEHLDKVTEQNVVLQLQHLRTHPSVAAGLSTGSIQLHGWVYDIKHGEVLAYDSNSEKFVPVEELYSAVIEKEAKSA